jgi:hypothetical protein
LMKLLLKRLFQSQRKERLVRSKKKLWRLPNILQRNLVKKRPSKRTRKLLRMLKKKLVKKLLQRYKPIKSLPKLILILKKNQRSSRLQSCRTLTRLRLTKS